MANDIQLADCLSSQAYSWDENQQLAVRNGLSNNCPAEVALDPEVAEEVMKNYELDLDKDSLWFNARKYLDILQESPKRKAEKSDRIQGYFAGEKILGAERDPKKQLVLSYIKYPTSFNPVVRNTVAEEILYNFMYAPLMRLSMKGDNSLESELAESITDHNDGTYTIRLRDGIFWSDSKPITADDLIYTYQLVFEKENILTERSNYIVGGALPTVTKKDTRTVVLTFARPISGMEYIMASLYVAPKHAIEPRMGEVKNIRRVLTISTDPKHIITSGPYRVTSHATDQHIAFERNPHYFKRDTRGTQLPYIPRARIVVVPDQNAQANAFINGEANLFETKADMADYLFSRRAAGNFHTFSAPVSMLAALYFNLRPQNTEGRDYLLNKEFRKGVRASISRNDIRRIVFQNRADSIPCFTNPEAQPWYKNCVEEKQDSDAAKHHFANAGLHYEDKQLMDAKGHPVTFSLLYPNTYRSREYAVNLIQDDLQKAGIAVHTIPSEGGAFWASVEAGTGWDSALTGEYYALGPQSWKSGFVSDGNTRYWSTPKTPEERTPWEISIDQIYASIETNNPLNDRVNAFFAAVDVLREEVPVIPLYSDHAIYAASNTLCNTGMVQYAFFPPNPEELFWANENGKCEP